MTGHLTVAGCLTAALLPLGILAISQFQQRLDRLLGIDWHRWPNGRGDE